MEKVFFLHRILGPQSDKVTRWCRRMRSKENTQGETVSILVGIMETRLVPVCMGSIWTPCVLSSVVNPNWPYSLLIIKFVQAVGPYNKPFQHLSFRYRLTYIDRYMLSLPGASVNLYHFRKVICIEHGELQLIITQ